jgi:ATP:ADP antiporter, AAA family
MQTRNESDTSVHAAAFSAAALIAHQVGGKAMRDALFLSHFDVTGLAWMVIAASVLSIAIGVAGARLMSSASPGRVVPRAFLASAMLLLAEWGLSWWSNAVVAILVYLQIAALGSALISGFWSLLGDRFDPHTARKQFGRIVAASTFGGMIGGLLAERVGTTFGVTAMLPVLAALDLICAFLTSGLGRGLKPATTSRSERSSKHVVAGFSPRGLFGEPYLRDLAVLIVLTTLGAGLLDYVFKARAVAAHSGGADLVRFFAIFYTTAGVMTFLVQIALSRLSLEKFGLAGTIGSLPFAVANGSFGGILMPGIGATAIARGSETVLRSSLFRSGYELFFAAVPKRHRRGIKPILDVGFERIGDMFGGVLITLLLLAGSRVALSSMLTIAALTGLIGLWISRRLHHGYVKALETNLMNQSIHIDISDIRDSTTRAAVMQTLSNPMRAPEAENRSVPLPLEQPKVVDPFIQRIADFRSNDPETARRALREPLDATMASHVITLLAWDALADDAVNALQGIAPSITGQLVDALLDPAQEFAIRRRLPRVLSVCDSKRAFDGLTQGLFDNRFEVRFQAGRALAQIQDRVPDVTVDHSLIIDAVLRELAVDREVWESRSVIDAADHELSSISSEHVFRLLSLILPRDPLRIAYRGLHSGDAHLKGVAIEYLESVLPAEVRSVLQAKQASYLGA